MKDPAAYLEQAIAEAGERRERLRREEEERVAVQRAKDSCEATVRLRNDLIHLLGTELVNALELRADMVYSTRGGGVTPAVLPSVLPLAVALLSYRDNRFELWRTYDSLAERTRWHVSLWDSIYWVRRSPAPLGWDDDEFCDGLLTLLGEP